VLPLAGIPLIAHSIRAAESASLVNRVVVSTEDAEIASIARTFGSEVVDRPVDLAGDEATSESALLHALESLHEKQGYRPDILCFLQCTSPLTAPGDIDGLIGTLIAEKADSALTVSRFHYFVWKQDGDDGFIGVNHDKRVRLRRQDRDAEFLETGAAYAMVADRFRVARHRFFGRTVIHEMPASRVLEIDEPDDFVIARQRLSRSVAKVSKLPSPLQGIVFDFDGVFTDDRVLVDEHGTESVRCSRRDGLGIEMLRKARVPMMVISKERNAVVARRCEKLQLEYRLGEDRKIDVLKRWMGDNGMNAANIIYVGNDVNDLDCLTAVGCAVAPADAHPAALAVASIVLSSEGGRGAIRELADMIVRSDT